MTSTRIVTLGLAALIVCFIGYLIYASKPTPWAEANGCTVVASRVIPRTGSGGATTYAGEYRVQYEVSGQPHFAWVDSGTSDDDQERAQQKVSALPAGCPVRIRYNPLKPDESVTYAASH
jgi:hypothetical protein